MPGTRSLSDHPDTHTEIVRVTRFLYDFVSVYSGIFTSSIFELGSDLQVTFPNGVFSGAIISSIVPNSDIKQTAEWDLLLGTIALPGVFIGAALCNPLGRRNTVSLHHIYLLACNACLGVLIVFIDDCGTVSR